MAEHSSDSRIERPARRTGATRGTRWASADGQVAQSFPRKRESRIDPRFRGTFLLFVRSIVFRLEKRWRMFPVRIASHPKSA